MSFFDAHIHLSDVAYDGIRDVVFEQYRRSCCGAVVCAVNEDDWERVQQIRASESWVIPSFGIHPWFVDSVKPQWQDRLESLLCKEPFAGVGECGIDTRKKPEFLTEQQCLFEDQLHLAQKFFRPLSLHCVCGFDLLFRSLDRVAGGKNRKWQGIVHSFSASKEIADACIRRGLELSFSSSVLSPKRVRLHELVSVVSSQVYHVETDGPNIGYSKDAADTQDTILQTISAIAKLRNTTSEEILQETIQNSKRLFLKNRGEV